MAEIYPESFFTCRLHGAGRILRAIYARGPIFFCMRIRLFLAALMTATAAHAVSPYRTSREADCVSSATTAPNLRDLDTSRRILTPMENEFLKVLGAIGLYVVVMAGGIAAARAWSRRNLSDDEER
jgi:hypothetical protein